MESLLRRKAVALDALPDHHRLKPTLSWWHLIPLGVGAIVGTGIYALIGVGVNLAGPAIILSFVVAGLVCACAALAYAEVATMIPASGSAYTYSYVVLGEIIAWVVGWSLILEYSLVASAVAVGWSGYAVGALNGMGAHLPPALSVGFWAGGVVNLPAVIVIGVVAGALMLGTRESATVNGMLVAVKILALLLFIVVAALHFNAANLRPFNPYSFVGPDIGGKRHGVMAAAAIMFFAFYGFDALSTAAEETKRPGRDLPVGIIGSMLICTVLYIVVATVAVGAMPFGSFANSPEPLAVILRGIGQGGMAFVIAGAAVVAIPTVIFAFLYGQSRIFFVMARDGLLPTALAKVNPGTGTPVRITLVTAVAVAILAGLAPLDQIAALANAGTLAAFIAVSVCMLVLRRRAPSEPRIYRTPLARLVGPAAILGCLYLFWNLQTETKLFFALWNLLGLGAYFVWRFARPRAV
ncbi:MAG TPA: amino acid permease [Caulobacteraceae bacterium]|nr:amino acid permease [Caulobacteraceae bacterium]